MAAPGGMAVRPIPGPGLDGRRGRAKILAVLAILGGRDAERLKAAPATRAAQNDREVRKIIEDDAAKTPPPQGTGPWPARNRAGGR